MIEHTYFATTPKGMEPLLVAEFNQLGAQKVTAGSAGVSFTGDIKTAYRACLWSRLANRILLPIDAFPATDEKALYNGVRALDWSVHLSSTSTLAGWPPCLPATLPSTHRFKLTPQVCKNLNNGELACKLQLYRISTGTLKTLINKQENLAATQQSDNQNQQNQADEDGSFMFANRLTKNFKSLSTWPKMPVYTATVSMMPIYPNTRSPSTYTLAQMRYYAFMFKNTPPPKRLMPTLHKCACDKLCSVSPKYLAATGTRST